METATQPIEGLPHTLIWRLDAAAVFDRHRALQTLALVRPPPMTRMDVVELIDESRARCVLVGRRETGKFYTHNQEQGGSVNLCAVWGTSASVLLIVHV